ncbi:MAG: hypothetical protein GY708_26380 [Actinomycetia bacterium]|nr:hypothetical protein [Actinomycetes bacterium]MCP4957986.1 hypothetical protein [Actinomycetes bacterium]
MTANITLDAGALIALDRNDRYMWSVLRVAADDGTIVQVPAGVIAQAWRGGPRQALLSRALRHCDEISLDGATARAAGILCAQTATSDVIDATVALAAGSIARSGDSVVFTSDPIDITHLTERLDGPIWIETV